ncbi:dihydrodipicolinate synthase family protein [uncultured Tateyamaria sp.]|uniref:dihydrodipicolinate synthase family protein n=1 Tax=uncultured Tateyamaria sp. TaxID=455651 RepID=UPI002602EF79|nr:dihydrodipicolinate synthase family protein [uncultured Tateyamaria sp.]
MTSFGVSTAMLTPFATSGEIDCDRLCAHALCVLKNGADSITLFGTTGEGASIGMEERAAGIEALLATGCPAEKIVLGIAANSVSDASRQVAEGRRYGVTDFLLLPPFYFKAPSDAGLFDWHMQLFQRSDSAARFIIYNIPQISGVGLAVPLVGRMVAAAQDRVLAIKDSSGSWDNARALLALDTVTVLVGDERILHKAVKLGAGGAITGMANLYPERMKRIVETAQEDTALSAEVTQIVSVPVVAALKAVLSSRMKDPDWERVRAPLSPLGNAQRALVPGLDEKVA